MKIQTSKNFHTKYGYYIHSHKIDIDRYMYFWSILIKYLIPSILCFFKIVAKDIILMRTK